MDIITIIMIFLCIAIAIIFYIIGRKIGIAERNKWWEKELPGYKKDAILRSRSVLGGQFSEQLAPFLPNFGHLPTECKFLGKPIDFMVFKGMDKKDINEIVFVEVKSGNARLSPVEKKLKETIDKKRVRWVEYRIPKELTKKANIEEKIEEILEAAEESIEKKGKK